MAGNKNYRGGPPFVSRENRIPEGQTVWMDSAIGQFAITEFDGDEESPEVGTTVRLSLPQARRPTLHYNITALTEQELQNLKTLFDMLFEKALPVVQERDRVADDAFQRGDDSYKRLYRSLSRLVVRERKVRTDGEVVRVGPEDVHAGHGDGDHPGGELRSDGEGVAPGVAGETEPQDDDKAND